MNTARCPCARPLYARQPIAQANRASLAPITRRSSEGAWPGLRRSRSHAIAVLNRPRITDSSTTMSFEEAWPKRALCNISSASAAQGYSTRCQRAKPRKAQ